LLESKGVAIINVQNVNCLATDSLSHLRIALPFFNLVCAEFLGLFWILFIQYSDCPVSWVTKDSFVSCQAKHSTHSGKLTTHASSDQIKKPRNYVLPFTKYLFVVVLNQGQKQLLEVTHLCM